MQHGIMEAMANPLPRLRADLDFMPSPIPERPGLLIRDPHGYSDVTLIIPPPLVACLRFFDGQSTDLDLREQLVRMTQSLQVTELMEHLINTLQRAGFFEDEHYHRLRAERHRQFRESPVREASHAGAAYPEDPQALRALLDRYFREASVDEAVPDPLVGIAAPHVSLEGGWRCYAAAYRCLPEQYRDRTFVILGTSHYGTPNRFGLTRKPFRTPLGQAETAVELVEQLAAEASDSVEMEDYCHAIEHSVEFQVVLLQYRYGPGIQILPILVGSFTPTQEGQRLPEQTDTVRQFLGALRNLADGQGDRLVWVLGIDLAHIGRRYGDPFSARVMNGTMRHVAQCDQERLQQLLGGDLEAFWKSLGYDWRDELKWCGSSVLYTFARAVGPVSGRLLKYDQWNIDEQSVVSFAAIAFFRS